MFFYNPNCFLVISRVIPLRLSQPPLVSSSRQSFECHGSSAQSTLRASVVAHFLEVKSPPSQGFQSDRAASIFQSFAFFHSADAPSAVSQFPFLVQPRVTSSRSLHRSPITHFCTLLQHCWCVSMISDAQSLVASVAPSLVSGVVVAVAFNPIDRALYLYCPPSTTAPRTVSDDSACLGNQIVARISRILTRHLQLCQRKAAAVYFGKLQARALSAPRQIVWRSLIAF
jgi:hypothetical protein